LKLVLGIFFGLVLVLSTYTGNASAEFDKKSCIAKIPKDASSVVKNKMRRDCEDKEAVEYNDKLNYANLKKQIEFFSKKGNDYSCEENYEKYKILGETKFRKWTHSRQANFDICIAVYKDPVWEYKGVDRAQKLYDWFEKYVKDREAKAKSAKSQSLGTMVGNVKTPDLEELEKRINKKLEKLEKENKQLKEQLKEQLKNKNKK